MRLVPLVFAALLAVGDVLAVSQPVLPGQLKDRATSPKSTSKPSAATSTAAPKTFPTFATSPPPSGTPPSVISTSTYQNVTAAGATSTASGGLSPTGGGSTSGTPRVAVDPFYSIVGTAVVYCMVLGGL